MKPRSRHRQVLSVDFGGSLSLSDLVRELDLPVEVDFLEASSYGDGMESTVEGFGLWKDLGAARSKGATLAFGRRHR